MNEWEYSSVVLTNGFDTPQPIFVVDLSWFFKLKKNMIVGEKKKIFFFYE
jgi:hypothetical protein